MVKQLAFNIDNKFNNCPEFIGRISATIPTAEESNYIVLNFYHESVGNKRQKGYCIRRKIYYAKLPVDTDYTHYNPDTHLEKLIEKVNQYTAKITQEMHGLDFSSVYSECLELKCYLSEPSPCRNATSFDELLNYGVAVFNNWVHHRRGSSKSS